MTARHVAPPKVGDIYYRAAGGAAPSPTIKVLGVPQRVTDAELSSLVAAVAYHKLGLFVTEGDSQWASVISWPRLVAQARDREIELPASAVKEALQAARHGLNTTVHQIQTYRWNSEEAPPEVRARYSELLAEVERLEAEARK